MTGVNVVIRNIELEFDSNELRGWVSKETVMLFVKK